MKERRSFREWVTVTAAAIGAGGAWGMLAAVAARSIATISEVSALLFVGLPIGFLVAAWLWPKLPGILGFGTRGEA
jgi:hypothetical protein